jgi:hypothetical protein
LWEELKNHFADSPFPEDEHEHIEAVLKAIEDLISYRIDGGRDYQVERYPRTGMSAGIVNGIFWIHKAIPLLIGRYRKAKNLR